jgi:hypothetical protein
MRKFHTHLFLPTFSGQSRGGPDAFHGAFLKIAAPLKTAHRIKGSAPSNPGGTVAEMFWHDYCLIEV